VARLNQQIGVIEDLMGRPQPARERIVRALDECSYGLSDLRDVVAVERTARQRDV
jgi:hypothetical protein